MSVVTVKVFRETIINPITKVGLCSSSFFFHKLGFCPTFLASILDPEGTTMILTGGQKTNT